jgi:hypothetical protein
VPVVTPPGSIAPLTAISLTARGLITETWSPYINPNNQAPGTQTLYGTLVPLRGGQIVSNVVICVATAGTGTPPTGFFVALYTTTGVQLGVSANQNTSTVLTTQGYGALPLITPVTIPADGGYYPCFLQNGTFGGTTVAYIRTANSTGGQSGQFGSAARPVVKQTGQATPPSPATFVTGDFTYWFGLS